MKLLVSVSIARNPFTIWISKLDLQISTSTHDCTLTTNMFTAFHHHPVVQKIQTCENSRSRVSSTICETRDSRIIQTKLQQLATIIVVSRSRYHCDGLIAFTFIMKCVTFGAFSIMVSCYRSISPDPTVISEFETVFCERPTFEAFEAIIQVDWRKFTRNISERYIYELGPNYCATLPM